MSQLIFCNTTAGGGEVIPQSDTYTYDALNRISGVVEPNVFTQTYAYNQWGNRWINSATGGVNNYNPTYDTTSNRIVGLSYDQAGNITSDVLTGGTMNYDAENRLRTASAGGTYTYDANGKRTRRTALGQETWHIYGVGGELLAEYAANAAPSAPQKEYGYRGGQILIVAEIGSGGGTSFVKPASQSGADIGGQTGPGMDGAADGLFVVDEPVADLEFNGDYGSTAADAQSDNKTETLIDGATGTATGGYGNALLFNGIRGELLAEYPAGAAPSAPQNEYGRSGRSIVTVTPQSSSVINPSSYQTPAPGLGGFAVTNPSNTGHGSTFTAANNGSFKEKSCRWSGFQPVSGQITSITLKVDWSDGGSWDGGGANDFILSYSLDNGSSWNTLLWHSLISANDFGTAQVPLPSTQDISLVQVRDRLIAGAPPEGFAVVSATVSSIRLEVETDTTAPAISNVVAQGITTSGATITWSTNENSDSQVVYGQTTNYGQSTTLNPAMVTAHSQVLSGLAAGTLYHYQVKSKDAAGNLAISTDFSFTTASPPDNTAPVISNVAAGGVTTSGATITWNTNENADSQVVYGTTQAYGQSTTLNPALVTAHSQVLSGLAAGTLYYYRVKSKDAAGNLTTSAEFTFTTAQNGSGGIKWLVTDHLGSTRMVVDQTGSLAGIKRHDFLPFGEELGAGVGIRSASLGYGDDLVRQKFTGKERDAETGLDYFLARYHSSIQGRFTSVDPENAGAIEDDPQSWNGYAYAGNNPLLYSDPDGMNYRICSPDGKECYNHSDDDFNAGRRAGKKDGFTFSGDGKYFEKGEIRDKDGNVIATYEQTSLDEPAHQLAFEMQRQFGSPDLYKRVAANLVSSAVISVGFRSIKPVNLPNRKKVSVEMEEVESGHMTGGVRAAQNAAEKAAKRGKDMFPDWTTPDQAKRAILDAYTHSKVVRTQGTRVVLQGVTKDGTVIEMWFNRTTNVIETAYPKGRASQ